MRYLVAVIILLANPTFAQEGKGSPNQSRIELAADPELCKQLRANRETCRKNWVGLGGGNSGQAKAQKDCMDTYNNAGIAAGCWQ